MKKHESRNGIMKLGARTAHLASFLMLGQVLSTLFAGIGFIVIARLLGPSNYGIYTLAMAVSGLFGAAGDFGVGTAFNKFISEYIAKGKKEEIEKVLSDGFAIVIIVGLVLGGATLLASHLLAYYVMHESAYYYILYAVALVVFLSFIFTPAYSALIGFGKGTYVAIIMAVQTALQAAVGIALALSGMKAMAPIFGIAAGFVAGITLALFFTYKMHGLKIRKPSLSRIRKLLGFSLPLAGSNTLNAIANNSALLLLGVITSSAVLGYVGVATRTMSLIAIVTSAISSSILPMFSSTLSTSIKRHIEKLYNYSIYVAMLIVTPAILFIVTLSRAFTVTVFSANYTGATLFIAVMGIGTLIGLIGSYTSTLLISASMVKKVLKYNASIVAMQLLLVVPLLLEFKGMGFVALFYIITPLVSVAIYANAAKKLLNVRIKSARLAKVFASGVLSAALIVPLVLLIGSNYILLLSAALAEQIAAYPIIIALTGAVTRKDLENLVEITSSIPLFGSIMHILARYSMIFSM
ncbi:MAG: oligosaccharide flippase family protein [Candidatus Micrarchaeia archaeon]